MLCCFFLDCLLRFDSHFLYYFYSSDALVSLAMCSRCLFDCYVSVLFSFFVLCLIVALMIGGLCFVFDVYLNMSASFVPGLILVLVFCTYAILTLDPAQM